MLYIRRRVSRFDGFIILQPTARPAASTHFRPSRRRCDIKVRLAYSEILSSRRTYNFSRSRESSRNPVKPFDRARGTARPSHDDVAIHRCFHVLCVISLSVSYDVARLLVVIRQVSESRVTHVTVTRARFVITALCLPRIMASPRSKYDRCPE